MNANIVYDASSHWLDVCRQGGELRLSEPWPAESCPGVEDERAFAAADVAGVDLEDPESWVARVEAVDPRHAAIAAGDWVVSQGVGSRVTFVRFR